jgi:hypothetical protein
VAEHTENSVVGAHGRRARGPASAAAIIAAAALVSSCWGDCFFDVKGRLIECGTMNAVSMAKITLRMDRGLHGVWNVPTAFSTDERGTFRVGTASETCDSWGTLMFQKDGFMPLENQYKGSPKGTVELCLTRSPPP